MRILERTTNLIDLYLHSRGEDDVPYYFHFWCCISAIGAAVGNRVFFHRVRERPLYPNMYVILIGESGVGKGRAIDLVEDLLRDISAVLTDERIDIIASNTRTDRSRNVATVDLTVAIRGMDQLSRLLHRIGTLSNVFAVRRRG